jgi:hypothetical protein
MTLDPKIVVSSIVLAAAQSGCYVVPAETNDFSVLPDDALTAPIKKYIRSWNLRVRADLVARDLSETFRGRPLRDFERLIVEHRGSCQRDVPSTALCSANFFWKTYRKQGLSLAEGPRKRLCLSYQVRVTEDTVTAFSVDATCFE